MDKDGHVKTLPLFADIDVRCPKYTFSHPSGLLFATLFAQIALVITEKAAFEDMLVKGFVQNDCALPGHSLGEYLALASITDVLHISALVDVIFYQSITMQCGICHHRFWKALPLFSTFNPRSSLRTIHKATLS